MADSEKKIKMVDVVPIEGEEDVVVTDLRRKEAKIEKKVEKESEPPKQKMKDLDEAAAEKVLNKKEAAEENKEKEEREEEKTKELKKMFEDSGERPSLLKIKPKRTKLRKFFLLLPALAFLSSFVYVGAFVLPRAEIKIAVQKQEWNFNGRVAASKDFLSVDADKKQIPVEIFSSRKNINLTYPATGKKQVEKKAEGEIIIYNVYNTKSQTLRKETRFEAPDGKIFLLKNGVVVPGADIVEGKVVPSSVKAEVAAEKAGTEYNIPAVEKFTIPGFKGSPKFNGFYASSKSPMKGGYVGEAAFPTDGDISAAGEKTLNALDENLNSFVWAQIPDGFKVAEGGRRFSILKEETNEEIDENGNFSVFIDAELKVAAFKENDALDLMSALAGKDLGEDYDSKEHKIDYAVSEANFENGNFSLNFDYKGIFWKPIDVEELKKSIIGEKEKELKMTLFSLPGVSKATVSLWPFWVNKIPKNSDKIKVEIE